MAARGSVRILARSVSVQDRIDSLFRALLGWPDRDLHREGDPPCDSLLFSYRPSSWDCFLLPMRWEFPFPPFEDSATSPGCPMRARGERFRGMDRSSRATATCHRRALRPFGLSDGPKPADSSASGLMASAKASSTASLQTASSSSVCCGPFPTRKHFDGIRSGASSGLDISGLEPLAAALETSRPTGASSLVNLTGIRESRPSSTTRRMACADWAICLEALSSAVRMPFRQMDRSSWELRTMAAVVRSSGTRSVACELSKRPRSCF